MEAAAEISLRQRWFLSPTEQAQAPSKAAVLSRACSPVSAADPHLSQIPLPTLERGSSPCAHAPRVVIQVEQGRDILRNQFPAWSQKKRRKQTNCIPVFAPSLTSVFGSRWSAPGGRWSECVKRRQMLFCTVTLHLCLPAVLICSFYFCGDSPRALRPQLPPQLCSTDSSLLPACFATLLRNDRKGSGPDPCEKANAVQREKRKKDGQRGNCDLPLWLINRLMNSEKTHQI